MIERDANAAPAEERVFLVDRKIRQRLVAADVERAHRDRMRAERFHVLAIDNALFLFGRKPIERHERHFGAEQADTFRAAVQRAG